MVYGFDEVRVEASIARLAAVIILAPSSEGDHQDSLAIWLSADLAASVIAVEDW